jgi:hypothetical protein
MTEDEMEQMKDVIIANVSRGFVTIIGLSLEGETQLICRRLGTQFIEHASDAEIADLVRQIAKEVL